MKRLIILSLILLAFPCHAQDLARLNVGVVGSGSISGGYMYPSVSTFSNNSGNIAVGIAVASTITASSSLTITKLGMLIADKQTATACHIGLFSSDSQTRYAYCEQTTIANGWVECDVSYGVSASTVYTVWGQCNADYKIKMSATNCTNYYDFITYSANLPASTLTNSADSGCDGFRLTY